MGKTSVRGLRAKYPERVPIEVVKSTRASADLDDISQRKFLVPTELTIAEFMVVLRKRMELDSKNAIFVFINNTIPAATATFGELEASRMQAGGSDEEILLLEWCVENTFG